MDLNPKKHIISAIALLALLCATFVVGSARDKYDDDAQQRLIDYLYMEARRQNANDNNGAEFELYRRAYELDTTNTQIGSDLALYYILMGKNNDEIGQQGLDLLKRRFEENPNDFGKSVAYGRLITQMGYHDEALRVWQTLDSLNPKNTGVKLIYIDALINSADSTNLRKAITQINRLETIHGVDEQLSSRIVISNLQLGDTAAALQSVHRLLEEAPLIAESYIYAGHVYHTINKPDSAVKFFNKACEVDSTNGYAYYTLAEYYRTLNDSVGFRRETTNALLSADLDVEVKNEILLHYTRTYINDSTQHTYCDSLFRQVIDINPHEYRYRELYAAFLAAINHYSEAAEQIGVAVDIDPANLNNWFAVITYHSIANENDKALEMAQRATGYFPDNAEIIESYGSTLYATERYDEALTQMKRAIEIADSTDYKAQARRYGLIGDILHKMGESDSAYVYYQHALDINPADLNVMNNMAYFLAVDEKELEKAKQMSELTIREEPTNPTWLDTYAWILFKLRDYAKAKEYIDRTIEHTDEMSAEVLSHAGDIYFMNGEPERALEYWTEALLLTPDDELLQRKVEHKTYFYK